MEVRGHIGSHADGLVFAPSDTTPYVALDTELGLYKVVTTYHGSLTDQFRKTAAKINNVTSVTTALPF